MVGDERPANPTAQLRVAFAKFAGDPVAVGAEDPDDAAERDSDVALAVLFVQGASKGVDDAVHDLVPTLTGASVVMSPTHFPNRSWSQRIFDS